MVSQLNRAKGPEFRPDDSVNSGSNSDPTDASSTGLADFITSDSVTTLMSKKALAQASSKGSASNDKSVDSSSISSGDIAAPGSELYQPQQTVYMHLDMDAFYANVMINRRHTTLKDSPVVVVPAKNTNNGTSEVASANYEARKHGIRARMFVSEARKRCPQLHVLQVDFALIEDTSARMYEQILRYTHNVEAVSADEAYLDVSPWGWVRALDLATRIQNDIARATHCPCSIGVGPNKLVARLSTNKAKPVGIILTPPEAAADFVKTFDCASLPSVGGSTSSKLAEKGVNTVGDLLSIDLMTLQSWFGEKTGRKLFEFSRAKDDRPLKSEQDRKSVGTQISWGVRMATQEQVAAFLTDMSAEVCKRLAEIQMIGSRITLRVLKKKDDVEVDEASKGRVIDARMGGYSTDQAAAVPKGESAKAFNPGQCTQISKSNKIPLPTADAKAVAREIIRLYKLFGLIPSEFRGAGISIDDLQPESEQPKNSTIHSFFKAGAKTSSATVATNPAPSLTPPSVSSAPSSTPSSSLLLPISAPPAAQASQDTKKRPPTSITPKPALPASSSSAAPLPAKSTSAPTKSSKPAAKKQATITSMFSKQPKT